ncbi:MAG: TolC family protein [Desulfatiglans sp.]|nr:TolC family protein [Desulfatiglans sp.]
MERYDLINPNKFRVLTKSCSRNLLIAAVLFLLAAPALFSGCSAKSHRLRADKTALSIIKKEQARLLGKADDFSIEKPSDILRRRLLTEQELAISGEESLGTDALPKIPHWPEKKYPAAITTPGEKIEIPEDKNPLVINFTKALQIAAENSNDYQSQKETLFRSALTLDLNRNDYSLIARMKGDSTLSIDKGQSPTKKGLEHGGDLGLNQTLKDGSKLAANLAVDLVSLLTGGKESSRGISGDASITIPLLRGSKTYIYSENLTQAERNVMYAVWDFERYKKTFAVNIATNYFNVLRQIDQLNNSAENYKNSIRSARRTRRLADAGRLTEIEVDQAVQNELLARNRWISAMTQYNNRMDSFKQLLGLPPDAFIDLDRSDLESLITYIQTIVPKTGGEDVSETGGVIPPADIEITLKDPDRSDVGPMELEERAAIELGLKNRLDLKVQEGKVFDAQRSVVIRADALGTELTFMGNARAGESRSLGMATMEDGKLRPNMGFYSALLSIDLPIERTSERRAYRESYISLESALRSFQRLEDDIKLSVRQSLRSMSEAREALKIQNRAVSVAEKRVNSTTLFFEAGRAQVRDLLEAQDALLSARNSLTSAVIDYRIAELEFQRNTELLEIDKDGLIQEFSQEGNNNANAE